MPGSTFPVLLPVEVAQAWAAYFTLDRSQWLDPAQLRAGQLAQLRTLIAHCIESVPYYRKLLRERGVAARDIQSTEDLRHLPILPRRTLQEQAAALRATTLPTGTRATASAGTAGTSGIPVDVQQTNVVVVWWWALYLRALQWCGFDPRRTLAAIRATGQSGAALRQLLDGVSQPYWDARLHKLIETGPSHAMDIHQDPRRQLEWLRRVDPDYLISFPSNLEFLASLMAESGRKLPRLAGIQSYGETLTDAVRELVESAFGVRVWNTYSCSEAGAVAAPCPAGHGLHVQAENVIVEVLDAEDRPCAPGEIGRVILTPLNNFQMPLIRYDIMDEAEVGPDRCACGRGLPTLRSVLGRTRPMLRLPDGRVKHSAGLAIGLRAVGGCHQFQVVQRRVDHLLVRIVPDRTWTAEHPARVTALMREHFEAPIRVEVATVEHLERPPGGKLLAFITELEPTAGAADRH